jgi:hypothetical protein
MTGAEFLSGLRRWNRCQRAIAWLGQKHLLALKHTRARHARMMDERPLEQTKNVTPIRRRR